MTITQGKKKKPPTFHYLPKSRAKRLKKSWVEDHKLRREWKAQKKREGLTNHTRAPVKVASELRQDETCADPESNTSPIRPDKSPTPTPPPDKQSLRDLRRIAYASKSVRTQKADSSPPKRAPRYPHHDRGAKAIARPETGQPNMQLRMNFLLEKIKRDFP